MIKKIIYSFIIAIFLFAPVASIFNLSDNYSPFSRAQTIEVLEISRDTTWKNNKEIIIDKPVVIDKGATLTVEKGAKIIFDSGEALKYFPIGITVADGKIMVDGDTGEEVEFSAKNNTKFAIRINSKEEQSFFRYAKIVGGGFVFENYQSYRQKGFWNRVYAQFANVALSSAALQVKGGKVKIENTVFKGSDFADVQVTVGSEGNVNEKPDVYLPEVTIVNSNFSAKQAVLANQCLGYKMLKGEEAKNCQQKVRLVNDWYGESEFSDDKFEVKGDFVKVGEKKNEMIVDPVIIIPGILGSAFDTKGNMEIDPIWHKYDDLIASLEESGFAENENLFLFPYNWRRSNEHTAILLKNKVKQIQEKTEISKVDIVAHSMGGLVARAYAEKEDYAENINQLIFLGTPQKGAPKAYLMWEAGEGYFHVSGFFLKRHFNHEAKENGYDDLGRYIRENVPAVKELLPDYDYLFDVEEDEMRKYPNDYPRNDFLENLNEKKNLDKLKDIDIINFIGKIKNSTIGVIKVENKEFANKWKHGYPVNFDTRNKSGLVLEVGDETVPLSSALAIDTDSEGEFAAKHIALPTVAQCDIVRELTNNFIYNENIDQEDQYCKYVDEWDIPNMMLFQVFSPVDIQIVAPDGKRVGKDFETGEILNEIYGAYYTGYDAKTEFVTIPNPLDGEYKILLQGTGDGEFKIEATKMFEDDDEGSEITARVQGVVKKDDEKEYLLDVQGEQLSGSDFEIVDENTDLNTDLNQDNDESGNEIESNSDDHINDPDNDDNNDHDNDHSDGSRKHKDKKRKSEKSESDNYIENQKNAMLKIADKSDESEGRTENVFEKDEKQQVAGEEMNKKQDDFQNEKENIFPRAAGIILVLVVVTLIGYFGFYFKIKK